MQRRELGYLGVRFLTIVDGRIGVPVQRWLCHVGVRHYKHPTCQAANQSLPSFRPRHSVGKQGYTTLVYCYLQY